MSKRLNFPTRKIKEDSAEIFIPVEEKISKKLPVFYNPIMKLNRDITILLLQQFPPMNLCDPLAGTGIRAIRFAKELKYKSITVNDINEKAVALTKKNMRYNKVKFKVYNEEGNLMLLESKGFDFIDLDVFGSPNFMLDSAVKRLARDGILAVTATDTSSLCGTHPKTCQRKYWAKPLHSAEMQEIGLRILIRKVQLIAAQYEKALTPVFSYSKEHYMRSFLKCEKGKKKVDEIISKHNPYKSAGPMWLGNLIDKKLANKMCKINAIEENRKFLDTIRKELQVVGFYDIHDFCKKNKLKIPKKDILIKTLKKKNYKITQTHFLDTAIKSDIKEKELIKILK